MQSYGSQNSIPITSSRVEITLIGLNGSLKTCTFYTTNCIVGHSSLSPPPEEAMSSLPGGFEYADTDLFSDHRRPIELLIGNDLRNLFVHINRDVKIADGLVFLPSHFQSQCFMYKVWL